MLTISGEEMVISVDIVMGEGVYTVVTNEVSTYSAEE